MTSHAPRIALFGLFGGPNFGNEASFAAFLFNLRKGLPNSQVVCIAPGESRVLQEYGLDLIPMDPLPIPNYLWRIEPPALRRAARYVAQSATELSRFKRAKKIISGFDLMVIPGTGIFDDFGQGPMDMPCHLLRWSAAARRSAVGLYHVSVGAAEVKSHLSRIIFKWSAGLSTYRSFRDSVSKQHIQRTGFSVSTDPVYPDLAFSLPEEWMASRRPVSWPPRVIGVGVMGYYGWNCSRKVGEAIYGNYLKELMKFVTWLLTRGYSVRLLTGDARADEQPRRELVAMLETNSSVHVGRLVCESIRSYQDLLQQIAFTDAVVATRFHNLILSLLLERPAISVSYTDKNDALMDEMGLKSYCQSIETFDAELLIEQFISLATQLEPPLAVIRRKKAQFRTQLNEQYDRIFLNTVQVA